MKLTNSFKCIVRGPQLWGTISTQSAGVNIYQALQKHIANKNEAIVDVKTRHAISFKTLLADTSRLGMLMRNNNYSKGDIITVCSENHVNFFTPVISALYEGVTTATVNHAYSEGEILHTLNMVKPKMAFCSAATYDKFLALRNKGDIPYVKHFYVLEELDEKLQNVPTDGYQPLPSPDTSSHTALILFSSGTTGLPKGVMLSHKNLNARHNQAEDPRQTLSYIDDSITVVPLYHALGFMTAISLLRKGKTLRYLAKFNERDYLQAIQDYQIEHLVTVPPLVVLLAKSPTVNEYDLSSIKEIVCGAAPLSSELEAAVKQRLPNIKRITQAYGQTELSLTVLAYGTDDAARPGSSGKVIAGHEVIVRDHQTGNLLAHDEVGEVCAKGPVVMQGYFENERATKETFTEDGWLRTGDMAYYDREGYFYIVDRLKELIKYKGFQVAPAELEALLLTHDGIRDAAVIGLPDERCGELPVAFVVRKPKAEISETDVLTFVRERVSHAKRLHIVTFVDDIPKTASGKILRKELKQNIIAELKKQNK